MTYILIFTAAFMGSLHCVGMCGAFVVMLKAQNEQDFKVRQILYLLGKTFTYMVLGAMVALVGTALRWQDQGIGLYVQWIAGGIMILTGLGLLNVFRRVEQWIPLQKWKPYQKAFKHMMQLKGRKAAFGLGTLNGFLPCGLTYAALAQAAFHSIPEATLIMFIFGIATIPALLSMGFVSQRISLQQSAKLSLLTGILMIGFGVLTVVRGTPYYSDMMSLVTGKKVEAKSCCENKRMHQP